MTPDDILTRIDQVVDDTEGYIEWHGSADAATWAADGSHEPDELDGDYYAYDRPRPHNRPQLGLELPYGSVLYSHPRRAGRAHRLAEGRRTFEELVENGLIGQLAGPRVPMLHEQARTALEQLHASSDLARVRLYSWQENLLEQLRPTMEQMAAVLAAEAAAACDAIEAVDEQLHPTVTGDDRRPRPRRSGRDAQTSPYPTGRRR